MAAPRPEGKRRDVGERGECGGLGLGDDEERDTDRRLWWLLEPRRGLRVEVDMVDGRVEERGW